MIRPAAVHRREGIRQWLNVAYPKGKMGMNSRFHGFLHRQISVLWTVTTDDARRNTFTWSLARLSIS